MIILMYIMGASKKKVIDFELKLKSISEQPLACPHFHHFILIMMWQLDFVSDDDTPRSFPGQFPVAPDEGHIFLCAIHGCQYKC